MAPSSSLILVALTSFLFSTIPLIHAQVAPSPPPVLANFTGILDKAGQYTTFLRLLTSTQIGSQIQNQLNSSDQGFTVLAPTDNAFSNLKAGTLNGLSTQDQLALVLYHILPKFYTLAMFETVSNPARTQATGLDGGAYGLNFTTTSNQVNVSTGVVDTQINNALAKDFPLAVYQLDKVLLPSELFGPKPPKSSPVPSETPGDADKKPPTVSSGPSSSTGPDSGSTAVHVGLSGMLVVVASLILVTLT
ncbi:hypothetical protein ACHQM5_003339 [Ranunculus cassubicifolius]